jgi:glutamate 5-kinase
MSDVPARRSLAQYRRVVVKVGSALLVDPASGLRRDWLSSLAADIAALRTAGTQMLVVSSGAIALGRSILSLGRRPLKLEESQAAASVGQIALAKAWADALAAHSLISGQILVTLGDTEERRRYLNARATINTLLGLRAVPVVNENDTVATHEIRYGDNDRLAARVAVMVKADLLVLLSDVDGLYTAPPHRDPDARFVSVVDEITPDIEAMAGDAASILSRGGMRTKLDAGKIATGGGAAMIIASGTRLNPLAAIDAGERATLFRPLANVRSGYKAWIAGHLGTSGTLFIDDGAVTALLTGKSLLPAGVTDIEGSFTRGETVAIAAPNGQRIAHGLVAYDAADAVRIIGKRSKEIEEILGPAARSEMIHRDDLVMLGSAERHRDTAEGI